MHANNTLNIVILVVISTFHRSQDNMALYICIKDNPVCYIYLSKYNKLSKVYMPIKTVRIFVGT